MTQSLLGTLRHSFVTFAIVIAIMLGLPRQLHAHPMPSSIVLLNFRSAEVSAELHLPLSELEMGFEQNLLPGVPFSLRRYHDALVTYVRQHVSAQSYNGREWRTLVDELGPSAQGGTTELLVHLRLIPPPGETTRQFILHYDVIQAHLITHKALVSVRSDWNTGTVASTPEVLGTMGYEATSLDVNRPEGTVVNGFASVLRLGMRHIADGTDHLLFLLVLLLPACLVARNGRWAEGAGARASAWHLLRIVTAFTIGHSITLALGATGVLRAPGQPVEVLIAVSILVSAIHALRPLFPGKEGAIAGTFGLIHGLAFASVIAEFGLDRWHTALSIFAFNVGIEIMQLVVVLAVVPWFILMASTRVFPILRVAGAVLAGVAALGWIAERALGLPNEIGPYVERVALHPLAILGTLVAMTAASRLVSFSRLPTPVLLSSR